MPIMSKESKLFTQTGIDNNIIVITAIA